MKMQTGKKEKPRDYPCLASAAPLDIATAEVKFRLLLRAQNRFDGGKLPRTNEHRVASFPNDFGPTVYQCEVCGDLDVGGRPTGPCPGSKE